jgi:hypothetical protein
VAPAPARTRRKPPARHRSFRRISDPHRTKPDGRAGVGKRAARVETNAQPAQAVATLALEIGRLQRDLAMRSPEGMEEDR